MRIWTMKRTNLVCRLKIQRLQQFAAVRIRRCVDAAAAFPPQAETRPRGSPSPQTSTRDEQFSSGALSVFFFFPINAVLFRSIGHDGL